MDTIVTGEQAIICAYCVAPLMSGASRIMFFDGKKNWTSFNQRGASTLPEFIAAFEETLGDDQKGYLDINGEVIRNIYAITMVNGTAVCATHIFTPWENPNPFIPQQPRRY